VTFQALKRERDSGYHCVMGCRKEKYRKHEKGGIVNFRATKTVGESVE